MVTGMVSDSEVSYENARLRHGLETRGCRAGSPEKPHHGNDGPVRPIGFRTQTMPCNSPFFPLIVARSPFDARGER